MYLSPVWRSNMPALLMVTTVEVFHERPILHKGVFHPLVIADGEILYISRSHLPSMRAKESSMLMNKSIRLSHILAQS